MTGVRWEDGGGGAKDLQAVASNEEFIKIHDASYDVQAYHALLGHGMECLACKDGVCPEARALWRVVKRRKQP
ncbi:hypothetical protein F9278_12575 [Streptomyces phaeolivaceus]|uniref:Uncharacterized protein n=1 Tax=Streptomyces phaeolivaceus TaxID=2653200 RepID=A0A5P8K1J7_9ACTN|nr:hypothetical protein [Streptomyces phaeolivaceus]QFQ96914.1 hypothetical protein F9278_12575 [Streptomyces phaeolivaceus]